MTAKAAPSSKIASATRALLLAAILGAAIFAAGVALDQAIARFPALGRPVAAISPAPRAIQPKAPERRPRPRHAAPSPIVIYGDRR